MLAPFIFIIKLKVLVYLKNFNFLIFNVIFIVKGEKRSTEDPSGLVEAIRNALHEIPTGSKKVTENISESETDTSPRKTRQKSE